MNQQTFFYTNIAPMDPYLNDGIWSALEKKVQKLAIELMPGSLRTGLDLFSNLVAVIGDDTDRIVER